MLAYPAFTPSTELTYGQQSQEEPKNIRVQPIDG